MANTILAMAAMALACLILPMLLLCTLAHSQSPPPAIYVFGDSVVDTGNNNFLDTETKVNYAPYGVDYPGAAATGRFSNGYTLVDFISQWFGLSFPPPIMDSQSIKGENTKGFNYASGAAGILLQTGESTKNPMSMRKQVELFKGSAQQYLPSLPTYQNKAAQLSTDLSMSLFIVHMGSNDYMLNYFNPNSTTPQQHNPEQFADLLLTELGTSLQDLYNLGARKFVVYGVGPLGCAPAILDKMATQTRCVESVNDVVKVYNSKLEAKLSQLSSTLKDSTFIMGKVYDYCRDVVENPSSYGLKETRKPCCAGGDGKGPCLRDQVPCQDRKSYKFWDFIHPTEATQELIARKCFNGTGLCTPMNMVELVQKA